MNKFLSLSKLPIISVASMLVLTACGGGFPVPSQNVGAGAVT
jgi:hypothetical protein